MNRRWMRQGCVLVLLAGLSATDGIAGNGALEIRKGYFWDPLQGEYFVPRGMAYQTWNPPVGADQSFEQLRYDFLEFKKMHCNSVRCEMVWNQIERAPGEFHWERADFLVQTAEELGFKLFVLIGFQYAPDWFPKEWKAINENGTNSVVVNYEHPETRRAYSNYIAQVTRRYRNSAAIGGWILGNEYAYFDLWTEDQEFLGFDPISLARFQEFLAEDYGGDIHALNSRWKTSYLSFADVVMPRTFPGDRDDPAFSDLVRWREQSIGDYVAVGATTARREDPNHLLTYSMIGGIFTPKDAKYTCEDAPTIVARCARAGAPLDFWAVNNYAWATYGADLRCGDFGIRKLIAQSGLPVLLSETGHSSTDNFRYKADVRQGDALAGQLWEALISGAIGVHLFTWNDREIFGGFFITERGFGMANQDRTPKIPGYTNVVRAFRRMKELPLERLLVGSSDPQPQAQLFWGDAAKIGWSRANMENAMLWTALKRAGYQVALLDDAGFNRQDYTNSAVLVLSRCFQMDPSQLEQLESGVVGRGIHVHANADLPGQYDRYHQPNSRWSAVMSNLFGVAVTQASTRPGWDSGATNFAYQPLQLRVVKTLGRLTNGATDRVNTWKIWHGVQAAAGQGSNTIATHTGVGGLQPALPALQVKAVGTARTAVSTFALADLERNPSLADTHDWDFRFRWLRSIYTNHFGVAPVIEVRGVDGPQVIPDYRVCSNGSLLIGLQNGKPAAVAITVWAPTLLTGRTVEDLTRGGVVETDSDGEVNLNLESDGYVLLHVYRREAGTDASLVNANPNKLWFAEAPAAVWPRDTGYAVPVGYDLVEAVQLSVRFERLSYPPRVYAQTTSSVLSSRGLHTAMVQIPEPDFADATYVSSAAPGEARYAWRARLLRGGQVLADKVLPVRLLWGVRPLTPLPQPGPAGGRFEVDLEWQELPSYEPTWDGLPLARAGLWAEHLIARQHYDVTLELLNAQSQRVAEAHWLTREGTGRARLVIDVPPGGLGAPLRWRAFVRRAPGVSADFFDGFENRGPGPEQGFLWPWVSYVYSQSGTAEFLEPIGGGVRSPHFIGDQTAFTVVRNPPNVGGWSGFGLVLVDGYWPEWSLPPDPARWTNYTMSARFLVRDPDTNPLPCLVEMQVKDALGGMMHYTNRYQPGGDGWMEVEATLDQFKMFRPTETNWFHSGRIHSLAVNVQMLEKTNAIYVGYFDDIRFDGPERPPPAWASRDLYDSFEDRELGVSTPGRNLAFPWTSYTYPGAPAKPPVFFAEGIHSNAFSEGFISSFFVLSNRVDAANGSGFGYYYVFPEAWRLPTDLNQWTNYSFSFDFREKTGQPCRLDLQVKSGSANWIEFSRPYNQKGWDRVQANLGQFVPSPNSGPFDPLNVNALAVNVQMLRKGAVYDAAFDRLVFDGPEEALPPATDVAVYSSAKPVLWADQDGDGVPDPDETCTGVYLGPTNTGTCPDDADSDDDGVQDGHELVAGTNPTDPQDVPVITGVTWISATQVQLTFPVRAGRSYTVLAADEASVPDGHFAVVPDLHGLPATSDDIWTVTNTPPAGETARYYRLYIAH